MPAELGEKRCQTGIAGNLFVGDIDRIHEGIILGANNQGWFANRGKKLFTAGPAIVIVRIFEPIERGGA